ncbi:hypothetical protein GCM10022223_43550 [Kineosporia mesophila]|uniref:TerB family tellurite resistance protein n=1 Tax=Kineosporia mesophila TaxID=566012 RepID=A0ABP6ZZN3_9ACTN|nr:hypothetical protein [Kineosporia mesophila]MCD5353216.1 hypothetical protein [Kineosporia mesophila]
MSDAVKQYLRWVLGVEGAPEVALADIGLKTSMQAGVAAFSIALDRVFPDEPSPTQAADLIARIRNEWVKPEGLNPVLAERVILNAYGEEDLVNDVPPAEISRVETVITYGIRRELGIDGAAFESFLDEVVEFMNEQLND